MTDKHLERLNAVVAADNPYPAERFSGRGVVICAGGTKYFTNGYVAASMLRHHGCQLPIQFWHLGEKEMTDEMRQLVKPLGVECVDGLELRKTIPARTLNGWELKPYAIINSPFKEVLFLDADNVVNRDPSFLFDTPQYAETGAIFWPDFGRLGKDRKIWAWTGVEYRNEPEFESGQIVVDKERCWKALQVTMHLNEWSDHYYQQIHGDKETFHLGWRKIGQPYSMPSRGIKHLDGVVMRQHDFDGKPLFYHRNLRKWSLTGSNDPVRGFEGEADCQRFLEELRSQWSTFKAPQSDATKAAKRDLAGTTVLYVRVGHDYRELELKADGSIGKGAAGLERVWRIAEGSDGAAVLVIGTSDSPICSLRLSGASWVGQWERHEQMPIVVVPLGHK
jgi:hypothetical protein